MAARECIDGVAHGGDADVTLGLVQRDGLDQRRAKFRRADNGNQGLVARSSGAA